MRGREWVWKHICEGPKKVGALQPQVLYVLPQVACVARMTVHAERRHSWWGVCVRDWEWLWTCIC